MHRPAGIALLIIVFMSVVACDQTQDRAAVQRTPAEREAALEACLRMTRSANPSERLAGARELGRPDLADPVAFEPLCRLLHDDPAPMVRRHAAFSLRAAAYVDATAALVDCIQFDQDAEVRRDALRALGFRRDPAALSLFQGLLANRRETPAFRESIVVVLGRYRTPDADHLLCQAAAYEHSAGPVREQALDQLAEQGCEAVPLFLEYLRGQGFVIAETAVEDMRREDPDGAMARLVHAYRQKVRAAGYPLAQRGQLFP